MRLTKYQLIKIKVSQAGETVKFAADTDKLYESVSGMYVSLPKDASHCRSGNLP
jgi:hypothetical protein